MIFSFAALHGSRAARQFTANLVGAKVLVGRQAEPSAVCDGNDRLFGFRNRKGELWIITPDHSFLQDKLPFPVLGVTALLRAGARNTLRAGARNTPRARDPRQAIRTRRGRRDRLAHRLELLRTNGLLASMAAN